MRNRLLPRPALVLVVCLIASTSLHAEIPVSPLILLWTTHDDHLPHLSYVTPARLPAETAADAAAEPMRLKCLDGRITAEAKTAQQLADYWSSASQQGYGGIAIDEFGHMDKETDAKMLEALALIDMKCPKLFIAIWHAGALTSDLVRSYKEHADLVMLETYFSGQDDLSRRFQENLLMARDGGILGKTVFALGINDKDARVGGALKAWANSPEELKAQMEWIRKNAPEMPGVALFAPKASREIQREADDLAWRIFSSESATPSPAR
jgi:hypothetical protein